MRSLESRPSAPGSLPRLRADKLHAFRCQNHAQHTPCQNSRRRLYTARPTRTLKSRKIARLQRTLCAIRNNAAEERARSTLELEEARRSAVVLEEERAEMVDAVSRAVAELSSFSVPDPDPPSDHHRHHPSPARPPSPLLLSSPSSPDSRYANLQTTIGLLRSRLDTSECENHLLRALADEAKHYASSLEDTHASLLACKDSLLHDTHARVIELHADLRTARIREAQLESALRGAQDALADADVEGVKRLEREVEEAVERAEGAEAELGDLRVRLEGAERNAVVSTNRIVKIEAKAAKARQQKGLAEAENVGLREEVDDLKSRLGELKTTLKTTQDRLMVAEADAKEARQELEQVQQAYTSVGDDELDLDVLSDASDLSVDTLVTDVDDFSFFDEKYASSSLLDLDETFLLPSPPSSSTSGSPPPSPPTPALVRTLEAQLAAMALRYETAEAARVCGDDVEEMLRVELRELREDNQRLRDGASRRPKSAMRVRFALPVRDGFDEERSLNLEDLPTAPQPTDSADVALDEARSWNELYRSYSESGTARTGRYGEVRASVPYGTGRSSSPSLIPRPRRLTFRRVP